MAGTEATSPATGLVAELLAQAERSPTSIAVRDGGRALDYRQLLAASAVLAAGLAGRGVRPGDAVALCLPRSWQLVCAMVGVLRLGATVVPLDAQSPPARRAHILTDSASVLLIAGDTAGDPPAGDADPVPQLAIGDLLPDTVLFDELFDELSDQPFDSLAGRPAAEPAPVSFLFYTSGTTGLPKGVRVTDAGISRLARPGYLRPLPSGGRYACLSNPAFDALSFEVWAPLLTGGCCVILDADTLASPQAFAAELRHQQIDAMFVTTALFNAVVHEVPDCFATVGQVLIGGEQLSAGPVRRWYADNPDSSSQLYNIYGPTEATTFALCQPIERGFGSDLVPIGLPLPGTVALAVVEGSRLAEPGELAELYLGGEALATSYQNLPAETARSFVRLPWLGGQRCYRTGDLVRTDQDGRFSYVGRLDRQVKVRGFRIEPGEVERQLLSHPAISQAYSCTRRDDERASNELLGYLVLSQPLTYPELDQHLAATLPRYMRPHRIYLVETLPRTANGKVDQDALLAGGYEPWRPAAAELPATATERELLELAGPVLGSSELGVGDSFLAAGGDSLSALRLRFAIRRRWGCELTQAQVLQSDFAGLAAAITAAGGAAASPYPPVPAPTGASSAPASSEQQRLWLLQQQDRSSCAYNVNLAFQLNGAVDDQALRAALGQLVARHPALRTSFQPSPDGLRQQVGAPYDPCAGQGLPTGPATTAAGWQGAAEQLFAVPFDLAQPQLMRARWLAEHRVLLIGLHHIAVDGWSLTVLLRELSSGYAEQLAGRQPAIGEQADQPPGPLEYAGWQAAWFDRPAYRAHRAALREHYVAETTETTETAGTAGTAGTAEAAGTADTAEPLPVRPGVPAGAGLVTSVLDAGRRAQLDRLGVELGLTRFELLLGLFGCCLYAVTGRTRPRVASPVAGRPVQEFSASVGMFANTVLLPLQLAPRQQLREQLRSLAAGARAVLDRQDVVLADVLDDHDFGAGGPLFDFLFVLDNTDFGALSLAGVPSRPLWLAPAATKCALTLSVIEQPDRLDCLWEFAADRLDRPEVEAMAELLGRGLDQLASRPQQPLTELVAGYRRGLGEPGRGEPAELSYRSIADGFAEQVRRAPAATAVVAGDRRLSYAELDAHAAGLAAELSARFALPAAGQPAQVAQVAQVALRLDASVEHLVALLALARLNLTAVPLDPAYPPALLGEILAQVDPICILVPADPTGQVADPVGLPAAGTAAAGIPRHPVVLPTVPAVPAPQAPATEPAAGRRPLYTLFTSGSTGTPKGVQVPEATLCNLLQWQARAGGLAGGAVTQQFSILAFDVSFQELFGTLLGGGCLHLIQPGWRHDLPALLDQLEVAGIERIHLPYVALQLLAEHGVRLGRYPSRLREVVTAGEQLLCTDAIRRWFAGLPGARLFNHYGPTETHVVSSLCLAGDPAGWPQQPAIGSPVANTWLVVVDQADQPVPPDCPGDLLIGGLPAQPCYLNDPAANADRFIELPGRGRFYRSGDRARFDRQGLLHYLGRDDEQVKVSGHRLELGQVEAALAAHPAVAVAVVVPDRGQLVACLELRGQPPSPAELTEHLAGLLPAYVRIDRYRQLSALPRTASGKLDRRRAVHAPGTELAAATGPPAALSPREAQLSALFQAVIGQPIGPDERFFEAGASSLGLMRFQLRASAELDVPLSIPDLFEHVTIRRLARFLDGQPAAVTERPVAQHGPSDEPIAIIGMAVRLPGADDLAAFWAMVEAGGTGISYFEPAGPNGTGLVGARSQLSDLLGFDPEHFGISRQEARLMDPQQRHLLMCCVQALSHAGVADPAAGSVGLIASCGENTYFQSMLREGDPAELPDSFQLALHHDKDFLATKVAYHLGLTGPAFTVQAACASSLVAVHVAAGLLRQGDSELMLAGGVLVDPLLTGGYRYRPQHIFSTDGHCRPFSDDASGTIGASGVGVLVLKPLRLARRDGDTVYALITGSAVNNDGAGKLSYAAPALAGQREVIRSALGRSGRPATDLGYVEAHGTGTELGDPVEVGALRQAYDLPATGSCALASVKSQLGHLGAAAGVAGLIRASLAVHHRRVPPNIDFHQLNPRIGPDAGPFYVPTEASDWPAGRPRVAAVSSFGIGGTNAHLIIEAGQPVELPASGLDCLPLSASSAAALAADASRIADYLTEHPQHYRQVLRHLQAGRPARRWRAAASCPDVAGAIAWLRAAAGQPVTATGVRVSADRPADEGLAGELAAAWLAGDTISWPAGPAQPPWDFPPPAFALADYDFVRAGTRPVTAETADTPLPPAAGGWPSRLPEADWLHQPHWVRLRSAAPSRPGSSAAVLVLLTAGELDEAVLRPMRERYRRVVQARVGAEFAEVAADRYLVEPADPHSLRQLLAVIAAGGDPAIDWLHALPLAVAGPVGPASLDRSRWACLDTPAALVQALAGLPDPPALRVWWLSYLTQPVDAPVQRPELGLLAGASTVIGQESAVAGHWLDLPDPAPASWAGPVAALLASTTGEPLPARLALRQGFWWQQSLLPVASPAGGGDPLAALDLPPGRPVVLVLGGTGGLGSTIAGWLLARSDCRVLLHGRAARLPANLTEWADRIELISIDLAGSLDQPGSLDDAAAVIEAATGRLDGIVHAVGAGAGGLVEHRDPITAAAGTAAKLHAALLMERLIAGYRPSLALYCSSLAAQLGGAGQFDYAAGNGLLDGFVRHDGSVGQGSAGGATQRLGIDWDVWREAGMAVHALANNPRHQAHLATGLTVAEADRVLGRALQLQLPQLLVSTTALDQAASFYAPTPAAPGTADPASPASTASTGSAAGPSTAEQLADCLCRWLGLDQLDPAASLYELGADSLTLLDLVAEVQDRFGVELELSELSHQVSLAEVLAKLAKLTKLAQLPAPAGPATLVDVQVWQAGTGATVLCLVHPVGGDIQAYRALVGALDPRLTVCLIADPALRQDEPLGWSLAERAAQYQDALQRRFPATQWRWRLAGWSFGAWVALAMAAAAAEADRPVDEVYLLDPPPPDAGPRLAGYQGAQLEAVFANELAQDGQADRIGPEARNYADRLARCCRANLASMAGYRLPALAGTPSRLWLAAEPVTGMPALLDPAEQLRLWQAQLPALAGWQLLDTSHYGLVRPPHARAIAEAISAASLPVLAAS